MAYLLNFCVKFVVYKFVTKGSIIFGWCGYVVLHWFVYGVGWM